jgi:hypothetical protein
MARLTIAAAVLLVAMPALAQEPVGCDKFKWPLEHERAMLSKPTAAPADGSIAQPLASALTVRLMPAGSVKLPVAPTRAPKAGSNASLVNMAAPPKPGIYRITLSQGARIDVIQGGHDVKSTAFSGATGCDGIRKSVKFDLTAESFTIELTGTTADSIALVVTPD